MQILGYLFHFALCNEINSQKFAQGKYLWNVLKNRSNEIRTNEIHIRQGPAVYIYGQ